MKMSFKGGYRVLDLKRTLLELDDESGVVIAGAYETIEGTDKTIIVSGLVTTDGEETPTIKEYHDMFTNFDVVSGDYVAIIPISTTKTGDIVTANFIKITVNDDDKVFASIVSTTDTVYEPEDADGSDVE